MVPLRARIAERLNQSGPTVSQTVARMELKQLLHVTATDRRLELSEGGRRLATRVMRKHRLAECRPVAVARAGTGWPSTRIAVEGHPVQSAEGVREARPRGETRGGAGRRQAGNSAWSSSSATL